MIRKVQEHQAASIERIGELFCNHWHEAGRERGRGGGGRGGGGEGEMGERGTAAGDEAA